MLEVQKAIDQAIEEAQEIGFRRHLGASVIGRKCARQIWYIFRWAKESRHEARLLRLFDRGHLEEQRFIKWLRDAGIKVTDVDPETGEQLRISDCFGHFGGSLDSEVEGIPDLPPGEVAVAEFKTHNDKSFKNLQNRGVLSAKWEHYVQMQIYMHKRERRWALYMAVNKNDDDIYCELVAYRKEIAEEYLHRAARIIDAKEPPPRINESPSWFECKWCDYNRICHYGEAPAKTCRTCAYAKIETEGRWVCGLNWITLDEEKQRAACEDYNLLATF